MEQDIFIGVDVGTQGARVLATDHTGTSIADFALGWALNRGRDGRHEQNPDVWLKSVIHAIGEVASRIDTHRVAGVAVTATSGTLVVTDASGVPLRPAIMWDDTRAGHEAGALASATADLSEHTGLRMRPSYPLPKLAWLETNEPDVFEQAVWALHQSDWLLWKLAGCVGRPVTDPTNAMKTGYDPVANEWVSVLGDHGWEQLLPRVVDAGSAVWEISQENARSTGLPVGTALVTAMTDANTASLGAGLTQVGEWSSTLGTGLSVKGRVMDPLADASAGVYSHAHPFGGWLASGTAHTGGGVVTQCFGSDQNELARLAVEAETIDIGDSLNYPLAGRGEFFPFWAPEATGFVVGTPRGRAGEFRAVLEGVAVVERLVFDRFVQIGAPIAETVTVLGGATRSPLWNTIRANMLGRPLTVRTRADTVLGACITVAVSSGIPAKTAIRDMVAPGTNVYPDPALSDQFGALVETYLDEFQRRGYLNSVPLKEGLK